MASVGPTMTDLALFSSRYGSFPSLGGEQHLVPQAAKAGSARGFPAPKTQKKTKQKTNSAPASEGFHSSSSLMASCRGYCWCIGLVGRHRTVRQNVWHTNFHNPRGGSPFIIIRTYCVPTNCGYRGICMYDSSPLSQGHCTTLNCKPIAILFDI